MSLSVPAEWVEAQVNICALCNQRDTIKNKIKNSYTYILRS